MNPIEKLTPESITFNYYPGGMTENMDERWQERRVGVMGVVKIVEHPSYGEGDKWYWDVHYDNDTVERIFNPDRVWYKKTVEEAVVADSKSLNF